MTVLVTGAAGFIGFHTAKALLDRGEAVVGLDNLNAYYDVGLKQARLARLEGREGFRFVRADIADRAAMEALFAEEKPARVVHMAAQAGVRYSLENPHAYVDANVTGFLHILEGCRTSNVAHLVFASSSSVYGANTALPFSEHHTADHPVSLYAASKKANEAMAHCYAHLHALPATGLRFFTVYGPWGRPDMALFLFTRKILAGEPIEVFNNGEHARDFTYIDDIVDGVLRALDRVPTPEPGWTGKAPDPATAPAPYRLYNIANSKPVALTRFIECLEKELGRTAEKTFLPMQPGDVPETFADITDLARDTGYEPKTSIEEGIGKFLEWYRSYYGV